MSVGVDYTPLPSGPIISDEAMQQFEDDGAILVDLQLSPELHRRPQRPLRSGKSLPADRGE